jgi:hypothetical protein
LGLQGSRTVDEHKTLIDRMKEKVRCFNNSTDIQRYDELMHLKEYLIFRLASKEYETKLVVANKDVDDLRKKFVEDELNKLDVAERTREEQDRWSWSPTFYILKEWSLPGFRCGSWTHTQNEWAEIEATLLSPVISEPRTLESECPHIVKTLLMLARTLDVQSCPLAHPFRGLTLDNILDIARDSKKSVALTNIVHTLSTIGWAMFPSMHTAIDTFGTLHSDVLALLGYDLHKQTNVVENGRAFAGRMTHRALADLAKMYRTTELADM